MTSEQVGSPKQLATTMRPSGPRTDGLTALALSTLRNSISRSHLQLRFREWMQFSEDIVIAKEVHGARVRKEWALDMSTGKYYVVGDSSYKADQVSALEDAYVRRRKMKPFVTPRIENFLRELDKSVCRVTGDAEMPSAKLMSEDAAVDILQIAETLVCEYETMLSAPQPSPQKTNSPQQKMSASMRRSIVLDESAALKLATSMLTAQLESKVESLTVELNAWRKGSLGVGQLPSVNDRSISPTAKSVADQQERSMVSLYDTNFFLLWEQVVDSEARERFSIALSEAQRWSELSETRVLNRLEKSHAVAYIHLQLEESSEVRSLMLQMEVGLREMNPMIAAAPLFADQPQQAASSTVTTEPRQIKNNEGGDGEQQQRSSPSISRYSNLQPHPPPPVDAAAFLHDVATTGYRSVSPSAVSGGGPAAVPRMRHRRQKSAEAAKEPQPLGTVSHLTALLNRFNGLVFNGGQNSTK